MAVALIRALLAALLVGMAVSIANAATFEMARRADGTVIEGLRVEGEIVPGDAERLLDFYNTYGVNASPVYLRSKGGDVDEAMKMGSIIRRLRLETEVPVWDTGQHPIDLILVDHPENEICASACFLIYAGGASRFGNYLALHRPYFPRDVARGMSDSEQEAAQKEVASKVRSYLANMEVDQHWIDMMFAANSQERYTPSWNDADNKARHLMGIVPSLEEVILSKCNEDPDVDRKLKAARELGGSLSTDEGVVQALRETKQFWECERAALFDMQRAAFQRENSGILYDKCKAFTPLTRSEFLTLKNLQEKGVSRTPQETTLLIELDYKLNDSFKNCLIDENFHLFAKTMQTHSEDSRKYQKLGGSE